MKIMATALATITATVWQKLPAFGTGNDGVEHDARGKRCDQGKQTDQQTG